ncbi:DMT family transporter [Pollutimonas thiosulfatoxidans]|uniref:EamA family transporter n=1 Tax=Pollutimonas thiosulfatoxidans TaxID=2028345 RepID=A0A410G976_9BURK|nr:DMT family transporter [Pollutimonas thiosulfatoxidans]MBF6615643.1 EamA family transporter [Candidimonas sp.]NYT43317.1 EamA family transporter [Alcaligenaceae bacterium]QAA92837.1 EamA family transporter [Pollutimonas thiosulfatoxidans]
MALTVGLWGFSWIVMKTMVPLIGPFDLVMWRYLIAFPVLLIMLLATRQTLAFPPLWLTLGTAVFQTMAFQCLSQLALVTGGAGHVVMLAYTMPFWMALFAWGLLGEKPTKRHVVGFVLAGVGLTGIIAPWQGLGSLTASFIALAGGVCWGLGAVLAKKMFQRHTLNVLTVTMWQMLLGAVLTWPFTLIIPQRPIVWGWELSLGLAYMAVGASALGWWLWMSVVRRVSASVAGISSLGVPVLTVILAWLLLDERPSAAEVGGIVLILAGLVIVTSAGMRRRLPGAARR